jgi:hypothetical protein
MLQWNTRLLLVLALALTVAASVGCAGWWDSVQFGW